MNAMVTTKNPPAPNSAVMMLATKASTLSVFSETPIVVVVVVIVDVVVAVAAATAVVLEKKRKKKKKKKRKKQMVKGDYLPPLKGVTDLLPSAIVGKGVPKRHLLKKQLPLEYEGSLPSYCN